MRHDHIISFLSIFFQTVSLLASNNSFCVFLIITHNQILLHSNMIYTYSSGLDIGILNHGRHSLTDVWNASLV